MKMMVDLPARGYRGRIYLGSFLRYRPLWLKYNGDGKLTDFQVKCVLTNQDIPFEKLRPDKQDLLFITYEGESIPYWIESANSTQIIVWLKFSEIIPGKEVFWLYYGNGNFSGASNGAATFDFFDYFEDLSKWTILNGGGNGSASIIERDGKKWLELYAPDCNNRVAVVSPFNTVTENSKYIVEARVYVVDNSDGFLLGFGDGTIESASEDHPSDRFAIGACGRDLNSGHYIEEAISGGLSNKHTIASASFSLSNDVYYNVYYKHYADYRESKIGDNVISGTTTNTGLSCSHIHISISCGGKADFEFIHVRKYIEPEPRCECE